IFFFFSSRRRHTRFSRDWSSDVCSSDLPEHIRRVTEDVVVHAPFTVALDPGHRKVHVVATCGMHLPSGRMRDRIDGEQHAQSIRSEEHTSELQSRENLVCRLLLEKKKNQ